jgi:hypothetical protein
MYANNASSTTRVINSSVPLLAEDILLTTYHTGLGSGNVLE